jgi:predicted PurR-regulated permease PerM
MAGTIGFPELIIFILIAVMSGIVIWPATRICRRVGLPWWLGLLIVVPIANVILLWVLAFAEWPLERAAPQ